MPQQCSVGRITASYIFDTGDLLKLLSERTRNVTSQTAISTSRFIKESGIAASVAELIEPVLADLGYRVVRVTLQGRPEKSHVLQIMAERPDGTMTIDDCETISRQLSPILDVHDPLDGAYRLEVSSPGIDRPLVRPSDFEVWAGYDAKIELSEPIDGRRRFKGRLEGFDDGEVRIEVDLDQIGPTVLGLPINVIGDAHLILTDELVRESLSRSKKARADTETTGQNSGLADGDEAPDIGELEIEPDEKREEHH